MDYQVDRRSILHPTECLNVTLGSDRDMPPDSNEFGHRPKRIWHRFPAVPFMQAALLTRPRNSSGVRGPSPQPARPVLGSHCPHPDRARVRRRDRAGTVATAVTVQHDAACTDVGAYGRESSENVVDDVLPSPCRKGDRSSWFGSSSSLLPGHPGTAAAGLPRERTPMP